MSTDSICLTPNGEYTTKMDFVSMYKGDFPEFEFL